MRKTIARRLVESIGPVPHFFLTTEVDMDQAADAREALNALDAGPRISYNDVILKVVAAALRLHRECNAWWLGDGKIRFFNEVHLSMAVAIDDGLITPVIRNAHLKSLREIAVESRELAQRARERKLTPEEYTGGTFSLSNLGMFEIDQFTGVINPPEAGLLAVGSITAPHDELRPPRDRRRHRRQVPADREANAGEPAGDRVLTDTLLRGIDSWQRRHST
jgi:pyruvate dehydrogenase E2 component (dihydrolipoamide acetyltransferase)